MKINKIILLLFSILPFVALSFDSDIITRPLIFEYTEINQLMEFSQLECTSWRVAGEANNLGAWKTIPENCADYVKDYLTGRGYELDLKRVSDESLIYARSLNLNGDGKDAWIFDIDETLLSNMPYYEAHGYGLETFDSTKFDAWVETGLAPSIESSFKLYEEVLSLGINVILLTGRSERHRNITIENLVRAGFKKWDKLILRSSNDHGKTATVYKSEKRSELVEEGYRIMGNSGDQWSDLLGFSISNRSFKLPNPMYFIH